MIYNVNDEDDDDVKDNGVWFFTWYSCWFYVDDNDDDDVPPNITSRLLRIIVISLCIWQKVSNNIVMIYLNSNYVCDIIFSNNISTGLWGFCEYRIGFLLDY